jgi:hypothetical protein
MALFFVGVLTSPAQALAGDTHLDPIKLPPVLPMTLNIDTSTATADASDPPADQGSCYEDQWGATTFYSFTAPVNTLVEPAGSNVGANVYTAGPDGSLTWYDGTNCGYVRGPVVMAAGREYIIMVGSDSPGAIGTLTLREAPPRLQFDINLTSTRVDPRTGIARLSGTVTCNTAAQFSLFAQLRQPRAGGRKSVIAESDMQGLCDESGAVEWSFQMAPASGRFHPGRAQVDLFGDARGEYLDGDVDSLARTVRLNACT